MEVKHETKKIQIDPSTNQPEVTIAFTLDKIDNVEEFRRQVVKFQNGLGGQKELE